MGKQQTYAPGLTRRTNGRHLWRASKAAVAAGYPLKNVPLDIYADDPQEMATQCRRLQGEMTLWLAGEQLSSDVSYDGTFASLFHLYRTDKDSSYHRLKPASLHPYNCYLRKLDAHIGQRRIDQVIGKDILRWFATWSAGETQLAAGQGALAVVKAALKFGAVCGFNECRRLGSDLQLMRFKNPKPRQAVFTAEEIVALREAAHAAGRPSIALAIAIQFETALRLSDVIGQWTPLTSPGLSAVVRRNEKWIGLMWSDVDDQNVLRLIPGKTALTSGKGIAIDLNDCPMVAEEFTRIPPERRAGPVIVSETTRRPYTYPGYSPLFSGIRKAAGISADKWARDIRASAVTEGRRGGASTDDAARVAGHAKAKITAEVYDRDRLEAARRFSAARLADRRKATYDP
jgi:integrase